MTSNPVVSVILPTYNRAICLPKAINSVLEQDFADFELIVIDDGSTDDTHQVVAQFNDARIRYYRFDQNQGIGYGRSVGVEQARGKFLAFIDSDDIWLPGKLSWMIDLLERYPQIDILFSDFVNINHLLNTRQDGFSQHPKGFDMVKTEPIPGDVFLIEKVGLPEALLVSNFIGTMSIVVLRIKALEIVGSFNPSLSGPEDFELWWRAAIGGLQFAYTRRVLVERHKDEGSVTAQARSFAPRFLQALELCESTARQFHREYLILPLDRARGRVWCNLVRACALDGKRLDAMIAFRHSLRYGFSFKAMAYLIVALAGTSSIDLAKRIINLLK
ncbi:MAG: hypothetical protein CVU44_14510 [Chloroflexi bacterium HGW-Chloroflexi-6]|nr:MAG: hypothetical protein CVU44_14510 [Chloroflexi bacterium HGW-Chloroflexi-6]